MRSVAVTVEFAGVTALDEVTLHVESGEVLVLSGPNGAGKTTLVNVLTGFQAPTDGSVHLDDEDITARPPHQRARDGVVRTFQAVRLFDRSTVLENVEVAAVGAGASRRAGRRRALEVLELIGLADRMNDLAGGLPYGAVRRVGIARALAARPRFLLLDEPAAGMNEAETVALTETIRSIRDQVGCGVVLVEHDFAMILRLCDRVHVLDHGQTLAVGEPDEVRRDEAVIHAYLGTTTG